MRELLKHTYIVTVKPKTQSTVQTCTTFFPLFFFFLLFSNSYNSLQLSYSYNSLRLRLIISILTKGKKKEKRMSMEGISTLGVKSFGSVPEISVFPTEISVSGLEILPYEHFIPVTGMNSGGPDGIVSHCLLYFPHHKRPI